jgi:alkanesulfonate monooxygenase SsuD/methylene tetrahydromethanopterin reductase-like flavin-dependent oxidoreductase (luciferase family)
VANELQRWFTERAVDGYLIHVGHPAQFRGFIKDVVPILTERGLFRTE